MKTGKNISMALFKAVVGSMQTTTIISWDNRILVVNGLRVVIEKSLPRRDIL